MTIQTINIGAVANDGTGDPLRTAMDKVNANFSLTLLGLNNLSDLTSASDARTNLGLGSVALSDIGGTSGQIQYNNGGVLGGLATTGTGDVVLSNNPTLTGILSAETGNFSGNLTASNFSGVTSGSNTGDQTIVLSGDISGTGTGPITTTIGAGKVTNAMLANVATATFKGRSTAGTGSPETLTATQATALLNAFTGDSGAGGLKGLVPAPAIGDATKYLRGDGTWSVNASGDALTSNPLSQFAATTSAQLAGVITDETGTGSLVFAVSPSFTTPNVVVDGSGDAVMSLNSSVFLSSSHWDPAGALRIGTTAGNYDAGVAAGSFVLGSGQSGLWNHDGFQFPDAATILWADNSNAVTTKDLGLSRGAAGKLYVGNGTSGDHSGTLIAGSVGIGTTSPAANLHVYRDGGGTNFANIYDVVTRSAAVFRGSSNSVGYLAIGEHNTGPVLQATELDLQTANELLINPFGGNVGIGTTSPATPFDVAGNFNVYADGAVAANNIFYAETQSGTSKFGSSAVFRINDTSSGYAVTRGDTRGSAFDLDARAFRASTDGGFAWFNGANVYTATPDIWLVRDAAGTLAQRNGTNAQTFNIYGTYTDASNYEKLQIDFSAAAGSVFRILTTHAGTGSGRALHFGADGETWQVTTAGHWGVVNDGTVDIGQSGSIRPRHLYLTGDITTNGGITIASAGYLIFGARGALNASADGAFHLTDHAGSGSTSLALGASNSYLSINNDTFLSRTSFDNPGTFRAGTTAGGVDGYFLAGNYSLGSGGDGLWNYTGLWLRDDGVVQWSSSSNATGTHDLILARDAAGTLAQRDGTNAQEFRLYNTYSSAGANYERMVLKWGAFSQPTLTTEYAGTGVARGLNLGSANGYVTVAAHIVPAAANTFDLGVSTAEWRNLNLTGYITGGGFDATHAGTVPASGGGTVNFLRADGSWAPGGTSGASFTAADTAPGSPSDGDVWLDTTVGVEYTWVVDDNTSQWVELGPSGASGGGGGGGGGDALTSNPLSQFAATTSLQLKGVISDETGSGALCFATSPALVTPDVGVATGTSLALSTELTIGSVYDFELDDGGGYPRVTIATPTVGLGPYFNIPAPAGTGAAADFCFGLYADARDTAGGFTYAGGFSINQIDATPGAQTSQFQLEWRDAGAGKAVSWLGPAYRPDVSGAVALGTASLKWSDLYLSGDAHITGTATAATLSVGTTSQLATQHLVSTVTASGVSGTFGVLIEDGLGTPTATKMKIDGFGSLLTLYVINGALDYQLGYVSEARGKIANFQTNRNTLSFDHFDTSNALQASNYLLPDGGYAFTVPGGGGSNAVYQRTSNITAFGTYTFGTAPASFPTPAICYDNATGYVGISNLSPAEALDVTGNIRLSGNIELGHATDTTLARVSAGVVSIEGVTILTTATGQPLDSDLTSWASVTRATGYDTFAATPSSANLRALLTDESGTGAAYFQGGDIGTPSAGVLTNCTSLPVAGITASTSTALGVGSIELGHATDTTLSRASAGVLAVEGVNVLLNGGALGTPSSGALTNCGSLPISGLTASTSTAIGVGSIELGHASDTTIARSGAGAITVEGVQVILSGAALGTPASGTLTNCGSLPVSGITASTSTALGVGSIELGHATDTTIARVSAGVASIEGSNILTAATGQPLDATLTALAAYNTNGMLTQTAADTFTGRTITGTSNEITLTNGSGVSGNPTVSLPSALTFTGKTVTGGTLTGVVNIEAVSVLTDGATPALDASLGNIFTLTAAGDRTIAVPTNATSGQKIIIRHLASGGARTLALNTGAGGFRYGTDITALTQTTSGKTDYIGAIYNAADSKWDVIAYTKGF